MKRRKRFEQAHQPVTPPRMQRGQALTEMAILVVALVPLFLLIPMLGRYAHLQQTTQQAARGAAWEATATQDFDMSTLNAQQQRLVQRYFNNADAPIVSIAPAPPAADVPVGDELFNTFSGQPLVEYGDAQLQPYQFEQQAGLMGAVVGNIPRWLPIGPPSDNGLVTAEVMVNPQNLKTADGSAAAYLAPFDTINLQFVGTHTLLVDGWNAAGSGITAATGAGRERNTWRQVKQFAPGAYLDFLSVEGIPFLEDLPIPRVGYGKDVVDVVPEDRLEPYSGGSGGP